MLRILGWLVGKWRAWRSPVVYLEREAPDEFDTPFADDRYDATGALLDKQGQRVDGLDKDTWTDPDSGRTFKRFADGQVGKDISDLDVSDLQELRRVYGPAGVIPDEKLQEWAREAQISNRRAWEIRSRLEEISRLPVDEPGDDGYRPAAGSSAGTSPKTGVVLPPAVTEPTVKEWADLRLEQAYGVIGMPPFPGAAQGFSMRHLNTLRIRAARRDPSLSAYDLAILRSRGLV